MPREIDVLYGAGYTETKPEPPAIDPATYHRNFDVARQIIRDAVPPGKRASKEELVRLVRGWRADISELAPLIALKKQIKELDAQLLGETDPGIVSDLESQIAALQAEFDAARPPDFVSNPVLTRKRLRKGLSIAGPVACKSISQVEAEALVDEIIAERQASWTFLPVEITEP